jgi:hypothetical protein
MMPYLRRQLVDQVLDFLRFARDLSDLTSVSLKLTILKKAVDLVQRRVTYNRLAVLKAS